MAKLLLAAAILVLIASSAHAVQYRATCFARALYFTQNSGCGDGTCDPYCTGWVKFAPNGNANWNAGEQESHNPRWNIDINYGAVSNWAGTVQWYVDCDDNDPWPNPDDDMGWRTFDPITLNGNEEQGSLAASPWQGVNLGGTTGGEFNIPAVYVYHRAMCDQYWYGARCGEYCRVSDPPACTACNPSSGVCTCAVGYQDKDCGTCQSNYWPVGTSGQAGFQCVYCVDTNTASACYTCQTGGVKSCCTGWKSTNCDVKKNCNSFVAPPANSVAVASTCLCTTYGCTCQYSCKSGFSGGSATTTCQNDETWRWSSTLTCNDIDECAPGGGNQCAQTCSNTIGDYSCSCLAGYSISNAGRGPNGCTDINECSTNNGGCGQNCNNTPGSYYCTCQPGWRLQPDGKTCLEIDECQEGLDNCDGNATCTNNIGSFECACFSGFSGDGTVCTDIDECAATPCAQFADCANFPGTFTCTCQIGYLGDGFTCIANNTASFDVDSRFILFEEGSNSTNTTLHLRVSANSNRDGSLVYFDVIPTDALAGIDYIVETASPLVFNNGDTAHNISITIVGDNLPENVESIFVRLRDPLHLGIGPFNTSTIVIDANDNPNGLVRYVPASRAFSVNITAGSYPLVVERYSYSNLSQAVNVTISRTVPDVKNFTLIIPANKLNATINIPLPLSTVPSLAALYTYTITQAKMVGTGFAPVPGYYATSLVTINPHDDPHGVYGFDFLTQSVQEGTAILINLRRQRGTFGSGAVRVRAITLNSNQTSGVAIASSTDYAALDQVLAFGEGESVIQISITAVADGIPELAEMFGVQLEFVSGLGRVDPTKALVLVTIPENDDARGVLSVSRIYTCSEESLIVNSVAQPNNTVFVEVVRSAGLFGSISFTWSTHDGKFNNASLLPENWASAAQRDYVAVTGQTVTIPAGISSVQIAVTLLNDNVPEMDEFLYVQLVSASGGARVHPITNFTDLCINRNDYPHGLLGFNSPSVMTLGQNGERRYLVKEGEFVTATVNRYYGSFRRVSGVVSILHNTTTSNDFVSGSPSKPVTFEAGQTVASVSWQVRDDLIDEDWALFSLQLVGNGISSGQEATAVRTDSPMDGQVLCVIDANDDIGALGYLNPDVFVHESEGVATLTVSRVANNPNNVDYATDAVEFTATGHDFDGSNENNTHTLSSLAQTQDFSIRLGDDTLPEASEAFFVYLRNVTGARLSWASVATVTILASDDGHGVIEFAPSRQVNPLVFAVSESAGFLRLTLWREISQIGRVNATFVLSTNVTSHAAFAPLISVFVPSTPVNLTTDVDATPYEIVFEDGQNSTELVIPIVNNHVLQGSKYMYLRLADVGGGARFGVSQAILILINDDEREPDSSDATTLAVASGVPAFVLLLLLLLLILLVLRRRRRQKQAKLTPPDRHHAAVSGIELNPLHALHGTGSGYDHLHGPGTTYDSLRPAGDEGIYDDLGAVAVAADYDRLGAPAADDTYDNIRANPVYINDKSDESGYEVTRTAAAASDSDGIYDGLGGGAGEESPYSVAAKYQEAFGPGPDAPPQYEDTNGFAQTVQYGDANTSNGDYEDTMPGSSTQYSSIVSGPQQ
ncbi:hypothetical protein CAOG_00006 [Capsaspora owczarzaki ATCC 30864]|uniref:Uncharacterized protein n=1 Tax=Capsaspora owczarzaki (strain ATCC 30864) TaxID=595528 RepID=A0A0D2VF51_CAPO3|nr:hypothetical protein CAOG_00006 [Capsaspora owczarzaki ATCC 30864]KJE88342.1 hypothetical protein CAOG_000006 [Capsaspora owczarzaki ATCC 30864]|eukprot:XP_004364877.2 hypothetical protein CAOG_00006 [Capsaspora owczarzaki ATCC 30864]